MRVNRIISWCCDLICHSLMSWWDVLRVNRPPNSEGQTVKDSPVAVLSTPAATIAAIESVAAATSIGWTRGSWTTQIAELERQADEYVSQVVHEFVASVESKDVDDLITRIRERRKNLSLSSSSQEQILGISKQILAFGGAGLAASIAVVSSKAMVGGTTIQTILALVGIFYLDLVIVSLIVLTMYLLQSRYRYPFLYFSKIGNTWPGFYYASISNEVPRNALATQTQQFRGARLYAEDFAYFAYHNLSETLEERLRCRFGSRLDTSRSTVVVRTAMTRT